MNGLEELSREELLAIVAKLSSQLAALGERLAELEAENELLRTQLRDRGPGKGVPDFVKANRPKREPKTGERRKPRAQSFHREREEATQEVRHVLECCPKCRRKLRGGWVHSRRQQIEILPIQVTVTDHLLIGRWCGICGKERVPKLGATEGFVGKRRVGPRLMGLIATLSKVCRMPQKTIQRWLEWLTGLHLGAGEISEILHGVAKQGKAPAQQILEEVRGSPVVHADETGWREDGINGYLWSVSTPEARFFHRDGSRAAAVSQAILGEGFEGVLVSDFYAAYNWYPGPQQRCWVHLLRDLNGLLEAHPEGAGVREWVEAVAGCYYQGKELAGQALSEKQRRRRRVLLTEQILHLARPYLDEPEAPQRVLAKRIHQFQDQLFTFVQDPRVPADNNPAERAIRPAVIARKVSGGTRSPQGSETTGILMTLFSTWLLRGRNPFEACVDMLTA